MKLAIIGYGKMGRMIETLAPEYGFSVHARVDVQDDLKSAAGSDVAIEFSMPEAAVANIEKLAALGVPVVVGTTGWLAEMDRVRAAVEASAIGLVWSPNFSIGVNVFSRLVQEAAKLLADEPQYGAWAWEIHHITKKDAPSGTLIKLVSDMKKAGFERAIDVGSNRAGAHPGTHEVGFDSAADTITLRHSARSREGFARGALKAAQWVVGKKGVFEFGEVLFGE
ncbi:MAG TPA: dihydrodipicolinate reductase C-terminal domain-containing protein [Bryobacteraceae bacterium]|jgi:4-hydroxy-tetrahydrodipicolinate reductase|nr:dihydrodipicolinate reductase C-terminal domain-containing protein [Bryobacteraceae bacterium]